MCREEYVRVVVLPSVVQITPTHDLGSGIVVDTTGDIVTNAHVVGQAMTFQVRLPGSPATVPATLVGAYPPDDLAVIHLDQLPSPAPTPAHRGKSAALRIGDIVLAMGNPLDLTGSVTSGIVSATDRTVTEPTSAGSPGATLPDVIHTSASINPDNSGGARRGGGLGEADPGAATLGRPRPRLAGRPAAGRSRAKRPKDTARRAVPPAAQRSLTPRLSQGSHPSMTWDQAGQTDPAIGPQAAIEQARAALLTGRGPGATRPEITHPSPHVARRPTRCGPARTARRAHRAGPRRPHRARRPDRRPGAGHSDDDHAAAPARAAWQRPPQTTMTSWP